MTTFFKIAGAFAAVAVLTSLAFVGDLVGVDPATAHLAFATLDEADVSLMFAGAGIIVNSSSLNSLLVGFKAHFQGGLEEAKPLYAEVSMVVPSTTASEKYPWLGKLPGVRKWVGDRQVNNLMVHDYTIKNDDFEDTVGVDRNAIEDDNYGIYAPMFQELGRAVAAHPDELVWDLLKAGFNTNCYDGQYFFDTDHPVLDKNGDVISVANTDGGAGNAWFLADTSRAVKPIIFQQRKKPDFVAMDKPDDPEVFKRREFQYGTHARHNVGFGFWQFIWGSKQALDAAHFATARAALTGMKGDYGRPLGLNPKKLIVGTSNEEAALKIVGAKELPGGGDNPWYGKAEVLLVPWLD